MSQQRDRPTKSGRPSTIARHGRLKRATAWRSVLALIAAALAVLLISGGSVAAVAFFQLKSNIKTETIDADSQGPPPNIAAIEGGFNILLVGSDTREGQGGIGGDESAVLNDVTMLLHVAQDQKSATLVSIPRDMVVPLPACEDGGPATGQPINVTLFQIICYKVQYYLD